MYRREKVTREERYKPQRVNNNPSFSSTLLDEIYRSTSDGTAKSPDLNFYRYRVTDTVKKQSKNNNVSRVERDDRQSLIEKWMEKKVEYERKLNRERDRDQDALFFSSTSISSDSSGFSSSDTDSLFGSRSSCFVTPRPKPVRTAKTEKPKKKTESHILDDYNHNYNSNIENTPGLIKSKSRALKIYGNLKKVKQPISPGGRLASFINSLFTTTNTKKPKNSHNHNTTTVNSTSVCSSASSFSRSCLTKNSPTRLRNATKRSVRFYPVSVIVDEDCRPCGHKSLYQENNNPTKCDIITSDDDVESCASSDLFELDHLNMIDCEELPVYETTHVATNRAIAMASRLIS